MAVVNFLVYFVAAAVLLAAFMAIYVRVTPYSEFAQIKKNNVSAAVAFSGAILGYTFPLMASIFYTHSLLEMLKWAAITGLVQVLVFGSLRRYAGLIEQGNLAPAILLAVIAVSVGLLNAICISF